LDHGKCPHPNHDSANDYIGGNAIRQMFILALLYLPLGFFGWFFAASALMWPSGQLTGMVLSGLDPVLFERWSSWILFSRFKLAWCCLSPSMVSRSL